MALRTQLSEIYEKYGHLIEFAGFRLPAWYEGIATECRAARNSVGVFDVSHMGRALISGDDAEAFLNHVTTNNIAALTDGRAQYSLLCNENGGIKDDIVVSRLQSKLFLVVFNASNRAKDISWLSEKARSFDASVRDVSDEVAMLAIQGPKARATLQKLCKKDMYAIPRFGCVGVEFDDLRCVVSGTGYTGEDGFEIFVWNAPVEDPWRAVKVWNMIMEAGKEFGMEACGLGARDILRLEAGMCLYGNDIDESTTPLEAKLGFVVKFEKGDFIGKAALMRQKVEGVRRARVGLSLAGRGVPRAGYEIMKDGRSIGRVTSGILSPTIGRGIAMGYVPIEYAKVGERVDIKIRDRVVQADVTRLPLVPTYWSSSRAKLDEEERERRFKAAQILI